ncbi:MAG: hypothetical protein EAZ99_01615 [Alphaproteobacteria bacterium]|nr:MAG: hypothetical protein EAZ99_01615 [Alphaproteobacteria bacterium]
MWAEIQRCLWLHASRSLVIGLPVLGVVLTLSLVAWSDSAGWAVWLGSALAVIHLFGTRSAADAVPAELLHRTWDAQRLTKRGPTALALGKLLGAPIMSWYASLVILVLAAIWSPLPIAALAHLALMTVLCAVTGHGVALAIGTGLTLSGAATGQRAMVVGLAWLAGAASGYFATVLIGSGIVWEEGAASPRSVSGLGLVTVGSAALWAIAAAVLAMRRQFGFADSPLAWGIATLSLAVILRLWLTDTSDLLPPTLLAIAVALWAGFGLSVLVGLGTIGLATQWIGPLRRGDWRRSWRHLPGWMLTSVLVILGFIAIGVIQGSLVMMLSVLAWLLRDAALLLGGAAAGRRGGLLAWLTLALVYFLAIGLFDTLGGFDARLLALPDPEQPGASLLCLAPQMLLAIGFAARQLLRR